MMRFAVWVPLFDELADPLMVARLAAAAEEAGWDGMFVWDQLWWRAPVTAVADPWIVLAAVAASTERAADRADGDPGRPPAPGQAVARGNTDAVRWR